jgi:hypothetical protein
MAAQAVVDTEMRINAAAPHLSPPQRRRLALALAERFNAVKNVARADGLTA